MATPSPIKPISEDRLMPMTPVGFQQDPKDRPLGSQARLRGRNVVWAGPSYGWQSAASFERLRREDRLPRPDTGQPLGARGRGEAAAERNAGPLKPFVQLLNWSRSPEMYGPRLVGGPINALSRLGNALGDAVQGKRVDTSDAWVIPDSVLDDPQSNSVRVREQMVRRALGASKAEASKAAFEVTPADVAARPAAGEIGAQVGAALLTMGAGNLATGASALLSKAPALARLAKVADGAAAATRALAPTSATTKVGALTRLGAVTAAEQLPASLMTDYQQAGSLANGLNDLSVSIGGPRFVPGEIDPRRTDYLEAWKRGASWDVGAALALVGGLAAFPAVRQASYGDSIKIPRMPEGSGASGSVTADAVKTAPAKPASDSVSRVNAAAAPEQVAAPVASAEAESSGLLGERLASKRYQQERDAVTKREQARAALIADGHLEDLGDGAFDFPAPPEAVVDGGATVAAPRDTGAAAADAAGAEAPVGETAPGGQQVAKAPAVAGPAADPWGPELSDGELFPEGVADVRPEADSVLLQLGELGDEQLEGTWDRQLTPEEAGIDPVARGQELDQQHAAALEQQQQIAAELERNQRQQEMVPPRVQPEGPLVPAGTPLFHGTAPDAAEVIASSGFKVSPNSSAPLGDGVYFTPNQEYAATFGGKADGTPGQVMEGMLPEGVNVLDIPATGMSTADWLSANGLAKASDARGWAKQRGYDGILFDPNIKAKPAVDGAAPSTADLVMFDGNAADNVVGSANAKPVGAYTPSYEEIAGGDTRGAGRFFHGAADNVVLGPDYYSGRNVYGEGLYATDDIRTATTYQKKNRKSAGPNAVASVYEASEKTPVRFYDLDKPVDAAMTARLNKLADKSESFARAIGDLESGDVSTMAEVMDAVRGYSREANESADTITEWFDSIRDDLKAEGYGGFTHQGGKLGGRGNRLHQVRIYWDPENQLQLSKLPKPEPIGPVDLTALQKQLDESTATLKNVELQRARLERLQQKPEMTVADAADLAGRDLAAVADQLETGGELPRFLDDETRRQYINDLMRVSIKRGELQPPRTPLPPGLKLPKDPLLAEVFLRDHYLAQDAKAAAAQVDAYKATIGYDDLSFEQRKKIGLMDRGFEESAGGPQRSPDPLADKPVTDDAAPLDPKQEYLRTDEQGNLWTSKGPLEKPSPEELKAAKAAQVAFQKESAVRTARMSELQAQMDEIKKLASEGGCI